MIHSTPYNQAAGGQCQQQSKENPAIIPRHTDLGTHTYEEAQCNAQSGESGDNARDDCRSILVSSHGRQTAPAGMEVEKRVDGS